jgi:hypothetical protein
MSPEPVLGLVGLNMCLCGVPWCVPRRCSFGPALGNRVLAVGNFWRKSVVEQAQIRSGPEVKQSAKTPSPMPKGCPPKGPACRGNMVTLELAPRGCFPLQLNATLTISPWRGWIHDLATSDSDPRPYARASNSLPRGAAGNAHPSCMPSRGAHTVASHLAPSLVAAQRGVS